MTIAGCAVVHVDDVLGERPIVTQASIAVADDYDEATLHERIKMTGRALKSRSAGR